MSSDKTKEKQVPPDSAKQNIKQNKKKEETKMKNDEKQTAQDQSSQDQSNVEDALPSVERLTQANKIIKNRMIAAVGAGLIPFPAVDMAIITGIQVDTVRALSKLYDIKFTDNIGKTALSSLTGGMFPVAATPWFSSLTKTIPFAGQIIGMATMPVIAGASTYAVGQVFVQHFESGGTFLTFDPEKVKDHFEEEFKKGKTFAEAEAKATAR